MCKETAGVCGESIRDKGKDVGVSLQNNELQDKGLLKLVGLVKRKP